MLSLLAAHSASASETTLLTSDLIQISKELRPQSGVLLCSSLLRIHIRERNTMDNTSGAPTLMPLHLSEEITNDFSDDQKVGAGSYGSVYKGEHKNGETIAVKLLHYIPGLDDEQFKKEYLNLASLQHKNIVRLVGYCHETRREILPFDGKMVFAEMTKRALCFEYMENGSLDKYLSDEFTGHDWCTRYAIINGICQGLKYLHEELQSPMYHLDIKPANVLLDDNMVPKLADFGLSRLFSGGKTQVTKSALGTHGYVPPEYIDAAVISNKFDIFSLGVVIIKIMTGPTGYFRIDEMSSQQFIELVHANWTKRLYETSVYLLDSYFEQVRRCIEIALSCVEADRYKRPSIGLIVSKLNETETMIQSPDKDIRSSMYKIFHCISIESELMDNPLNKLSSYPLHVNDNRGRSHKITHSTICKPEDDTATFEAIRPKIMIIDCTEDLGLVCTTDVHPTEPWILVGHGNGYVSIWNHQTQGRLMTFDILNKPSLVVSAVRFITSMYKILLCAVRFIAQKQWFVAGDYEGHIHVYTYATKYKLRKFQAHENMINSLAVHPTDPFVLSSSNDNLIKLWNWENGWECIRTFQAHSKWVESVKFNPLATSNTFASASRDGTIKIWSIFSDTPITTLECGMAELTSVHYFVVHGNQEFIVAGSASGTACIWDLGMETCIRNVNGLQEKWCTVAVVNCLPRHPILVTVSQDHTVSFCNSNTHRYKNIVDFSLGRIMDFAYTKVTRSGVRGEREMAGKRKATELDAPGSAQPPPPQRWRGDDDDHSSLSDYGGDLGDADDERSSLSDGHVGSVDSSDGSETGFLASNMMLDLNLNAPAEPSDWEEVAAAAAQTHSPPAADQATEMEVQPQSPPPTTDQSVPATEVADHSVAAAAPAPEMVVPDAASVWCPGCAREPASVRLVPVKHDCLCLPCRSNPFFRPRCVFCDAPAVEDSGED